VTGRSSVPLQGRRVTLRMVAPFVVTVIVLALLVRELAGTEAFVQVLAELRWAPLPIALVLVAHNLGLSAVRWNAILATMSYPVPLQRALHAILGCWPLSVVTPSRAGDLLRAFAIRDLVPGFAGAGSVLVEKAIDVQSLCALAILGSLARGQRTLLWLAASVLVLQWGMIVIMLANRRRLSRLPLVRSRVDKVEQLLSASVALARHPSRLLLVFAYSIMAWVAAIGILYALLWATRAGVGILDVASRWPIALFVGTIPVTIAGMGTRDAAFLYLLSIDGSATASDARVLAATLGYSLVTTWVLAIIGLPFMARLARETARTRSDGA